MNAFRLQVFSPAAEQAREKEIDIEQKLAEAREEAYRAGFLAGQSAATESFLEDEARISSQIVEALHDASLSNEAARAHVTASIAPTIEAICKAITPVLAECGLLSEVVGLVMGALQACPEATPRLRCAPELVGPLGDLFEERGLRATIEEAPELLPREIQLFWDQGYDHLDLDACVAQIQECLSSHLPTAGQAAMNEARKYG